MLDYYKILNVSKNSNKDEIKSAYKKLALKWHPDRNINNKGEAENKFKTISEAYHILSNKQKRNDYDLKRNPIKYFKNSNDFFNTSINSVFNSYNKHLNLFNNIHRDLSNTNPNNLSKHSVYTSVCIINGKKIVKKIFYKNNKKVQEIFINGVLKKRSYI